MSFSVARAMINYTETFGEGSQAMSNPSYKEWGVILIIVSVLLGVS